MVFLKVCPRSPGNHFSRRVQQPVREKTRQRHEIHPRDLVSEDRPGPETGVSGREASMPAKEGLSDSCSELNGLRGEVVAAGVQGGKGTLVGGTPAFAKRLHWMNLRSLSILRF